MEILRNYPLKELNSFALSVKADYYAKFNSAEELKELLKSNSKSLMILGGGSNILFTQNFKGIILHNQIKGIRIIRSFKKSIHLEIGAKRGQFRLQASTIY